MKELLKKKSIKIVLLLIVVSVIAIIVGINVRSAQKEKEYDAHIEAAEKYLTELDYKQAIAEYTLALEIEPNAEEILDDLEKTYLKYADALVDDGKYKKAIRVLKEGYEQTGRDSLQEKSEQIEDVEQLETSADNETSLLEKISEKAAEEMAEKTSEETTEYTEYSNYELPITLWINAPFEDFGEYYVVKGNLEIDYTISCADFNRLSKGDAFTILDKEFILGERLKLEDFPAPIYSVYCVNDECAYYLQTKLSLDFGSRFHTSYYTLCKSVPEYDFIYESMEVASSSLGEVELKIPKDAYIASTMKISEEYHVATIEVSGLSEEEIFARKEEQRKEILARFAPTVEESFENHILVDDWLDITHFSSIYGDGEMNNPILCYIIFDENGVVDTIIWDSFA